MHNKTLYPFSTNDILRIRYLTKNDPHNMRLTIRRKKIYCEYRTPYIHNFRITCNKMGYVIDMDESERVITTGDMSSVLVIMKSMMKDYDKVRNNA